MLVRRKNDRKHKIFDKGRAYSIRLPILLNLFENMMLCVTRRICVMFEMMCYLKKALVTFTENKNSDDQVYELL